MKKIILFFALLLVIGGGIVLFKKPVEEEIIKNNKEEEIVLNVFFSNDELNPSFECEKVFSVERTVLKTDNLEEKSLEILLEGPTVLEQKDRYFTNINPMVEIQNFSIINGIAEVDFNEEFIKEVGGSCRVQAIRSQIEETLKQFKDVDRVVISVDKKIEEILQP